MAKVDKYSFVLLSRCSQPSAERREMTDKETPNLTALEPDLEREIEAFENSAIRICEILAEIKDSGVWKTEANSFMAHYEARWEDRLRDAYGTAQKYIEGAKALSAMTALSPNVGDFPKVTAINIALKLGEIEDPDERERLWREARRSAELGERTPTREDVKRAIVKRNKILMRDQKINEWIKQERERSRKSDQKRIEWLERELKRSRKRDERE
jgi:hypothetical protein